MPTSKAHSLHHPLMFSENKAVMLLINPENGQICDASLGACKYYGYSLSELTALSIFDINTMSKIEIAAEMQRAKEESKNHFNFRHRLASGEVRDVEVYSNPIPMADHGYLCSIIHDVGKQKKYEEMLKEKEQFYHKLLDDMVTFVAVLHPNGEVIFVNNTPLKVGGFQLEDVVGNKFYDAPWWTHANEVRNRIKHDIEQCSKGETLVHDVQIQVADGSLMWIEYSMHPILDEHGLVQYLIPEGRDLTERKKIEAEQEQLQRELQQAQKMEALGQLTGGVAHDFNNILGIIMGYTSMTLERYGPEAPDQVVDYLETVMKASERGKKLVHQMMTFSRRDGSDTQLLQFKPLIKENIKMLYSILPSSIKIELNTEDELPNVLMDPAKLQQLMMNLCVNARDAMDGVGTLTIGLRLQQDINAECSSCHQWLKGDWIELSVADTGRGMTPETVKHLFEPFYTTKGVGKGTGMGMAVLDGIVTGHGGHTVIETKPGKGTTFRLLFPQADEKIPKSIPESSPFSDELPQGENKHVLVLDDEPGLAEYIATLLELNGYQTTIKTNSQEALSLLQEDLGEYALLITDQTMPELTGIELIKQVRKIKPDFPVILCTGYSDGVDLYDAEELGLHYIGKPIDANKLIKSAGELLGLTIK